MKFRLLLITVLIAAAYLAGNDFSYPRGWDRIKPGMSRQEVIDLVGEPTEDTGEVKGAFWFRDGFATMHILRVYFEHDAATDVDLKRQIGTSQHFLSY